MKTGLLRADWRKKGKIVAVVSFLPDAILALTLKHIAETGKVAIVNSKIISVSGDADENSHVMLSLQEIGNSVQKVYLAAPRLKTIQRVLDFPKVEATTLTKIIGTEVEQLIPWATEESLYSVDILGQTETRVEVMLTAVNIKDLRPGLELLERASLRPQGFVSTDVGLYHALKYSVPEWWQSTILHGEPAIVLRAGTDWSEVLYLQNELLRYSRAFQHQPETYPSEVTATLRYLRNRHEDQGSTVYIMGAPGGEMITAMQCTLKSEGLDNHISILSLQGIDRDLAGELFSLFGVGLIALGLAPNIQGSMRPAAEHNLASPKSRASKRNIGALILLPLLASSVWAANAHLGKYERQLAEALIYRNQIEPVAERALELTQQLQQLQEDKSHAKKAFYSAQFYLKTLAELEAVMPEEAWVESLVIENSKVVELIIQGPAASKVLSALHQDTLFKELKFSAPITRLDSGIDIEEFRLAGPIIVQE